MKKQDKVFIFLLLALLIRLFLARLPGFHVDTDAWFAWAIRLNQLGFANFYSDLVWTNYTPGYLYILAIQAAIKNIFNFDSETFYYFLKLPTIIAEVVTGIIVYKYVLDKNLNKTGQYLALILFTPVFIFNSSIWGQVDGFLTLFMLLSILFLQSKNLIWSSIFFGLSLLIKPQAIAISPVFLIYLIKNFSLTNFIKMVVPGVLAILILSWPFFPNNPITGPIQLFQKMLADYPYNSLFAYNIWGTQGFWISDATLFFGITYKAWGIFLVGIFWIIILIANLRKNFTLFSLAALACLAFYFLPNHVHERYLYPAIPFLFLAAFEFRSRLLLILSSILGVIHLLNLYYVYVYYNELYLKLPYTLYNGQLYNFLDTNPKLLSFISSLFFVIICIIIFKLNYAKSVQKS